MNHATARLTTVRRFHESADDGPGRPHQLAIYDNGTVRLLLDQTPRQPPRLLARLKQADVVGPGDEGPQIRAICDEYVRQYLRDGGPLACRLTRAHLSEEDREIRRQDTSEIAPGHPPRVHAQTAAPASPHQPVSGRPSAGWDIRRAA
jgi:hypothetical protein